MINQIKEFLKTKGYAPSKLTSGYIMVCHKQGEIYAILLDAYHKGHSTEEYKKVLDNVKKQADVVDRPVHFLHICLLKNGMMNSGEKELAEVFSDIWYIALDTKKVYIFENQCSDFDHLLGDLEEALPKMKPTKIFIPWVTVSLVFVNVAIFLGMLVLTSIDEWNQIFLLGGLSWQPVMERNEWYRVLTSMFLHADMEHLYGNMLLLACLGYQIEKRQGAAKFSLLYMSAGVAAAFGSMVHHYMIDDVVLGVGASGAIMGVLGCMAGDLFRNGKKISLKELQRVLIFFLLTVLQGMMIDNVDNVAHVVGFCAGFLFSLLNGKNQKKESF